MTGVDLVHVVFPFKKPRFDPKMSSAAIMSILVIGQFIKPPWASTISMKDTRLGQPIVSCILLAKDALE